MTTDEAEAASNTQREGKAPEPDGMHSEMFRLLDDGSIKLLTGIYL